MIFLKKKFLVSDGSGGPFISGWAISFFPYLNENYKNTYVWDTKWEDINRSEYFMMGLHTSNFRSKLNTVPFEWAYHGTKFDMKFVGGLFGTYYNKTDKSVKPVFGYSVIG
mgnify:CR=1 FL=1